ncbi:MAG: CARDB domain-containing protein, partial [Promethearchaeota archaeon]
QILFLTDRIDYNPNIIATWEFSSAPTRMGDIISLGVGPHNSPIDILIPHYDYDLNNLFPEFMAFDLTDFYSYYTINNDVFFYLEIGLANTAGTISSFKLERYASGILQEMSQESPDTPKNTPGYVNATFMIFAHEIKVILKTPSDPVIHNSYQIKSLIMNNGANTETSVNFYLLLNGVPVDSRTIANIPSGTTTIIKYSWTPTVYDVYNFTAYVTPVPGETYRSNNKDTKILNILGPIFFDDFENGLSKWLSISGMWHLTGKSSAWPDPYHSPTHSMWFGDEITGSYDTGFREMGNLTSTFIDLTATTTAFLEFYHWREGESGWDTSHVYISTDGINWDLIYINFEFLIAPWEKVSLDISAYVGNPSVQIRFYFDTLDDLYNDYRGWLIDDVVVKGTGVVIPHELRVSLDVPETVKIHNTYMINTTVTNIGTSDESNVNLFLYRDSVIIDSLNLASLLSGSSQTINYLWTPTTYGDFNFTAYAPPIPGEMLRSNNYVSEILPLHKIILFDGMYLNYTMSVYEYANYTGPLQVSYTQISEFKFRLLMEGNLSGLQVISRWDVDTQTRLTENYIGNLNFGGPTFHTPFWIFTDVSLNDEIEIGVLVDNDHLFIVSGESTLNIPGVGSLTVWMLEDLTLPGGIAYYEKNTGILLNGTFFFLEGLYNYTFSLLSTNVKFGEVKNGIPGYNIIFFGTTIGFLSLMVVLRKRKKFA